MHVLQKLQIGEAYGFLIGSVFVVLVGWNLANALDVSCRRLVTFIRRHTAQTLVCARWNGTTNITINTAILILSLICINATLCYVQVHSLAQCATILGTLALANSIPLHLGGGISFLTDVVCGVSLVQHGIAHRWLGRICLLLAMGHGIIRLILSSPQGIDVIQASLLVTLCLIAFASLLPLRQRFYEVFRITHMIFGAGLNACLWFHIKRGRNFSTLCLGLASVLWLTHTFSRISVFVWRNLGGASVAPSSVVALSGPGNTVDAVVITIGVRRPWRVRHGQYIYLTVPKIVDTVSGPFQAHPYMIAWTRESLDHRSHELHLLVLCQRGFSGMLRMWDRTAAFQINGPYGDGPGLDGFDKVLFLASGLGIASHLLAIRHLLRAHNDLTARARRVSLLWILESEEQRSWIQPYMDELFDLDQRKIFTVMVSSPSLQDDRGRIEIKPSRHVREHSYRSMDLERVITGEHNAEAGSMAVSMCATPILDQMVRAALRSIPYDIHLFTAAFQMDETKESKATALRFVDKSDSSHF